MLVYQRVYYVIKSLILYDIWLFKLQFAMERSTIL